MKTIGLIGGMSWESTVPYYRLINKMIKERLGGLHSAKIVLFSVDFHEVEQLQHVAKWEEAGVLLASAARAFESAGAEFLVLCTNTMHKVANAIESSVSIPFLHIADATLKKSRRRERTQLACLVRNSRWRKNSIAAGSKRITNLMSSFLKKMTGK